MSTGTGSGNGEPLRVVGAGPSGLAAAICAARAGRRVVVHERAAAVGSRFHDDHQGLENWTSETDVLAELDSVGIAPTFDHHGVREQVCFDSGGRAFTFRSTVPFYYLVRRGSGPGTLDCALRDQALAAGVEIRFNEPVDHLPTGGVVARGPRRGDVIAVGYVFETDAADGTYAVMDDRLAPRGYGYLLIQGGRGTVATCMFDDFHKERVHLERTVDFFRERVGVKLEHGRRFGGMGTFIPSARHGSPDLFFSGEAAGLQDALWGFGMRYAMRSGVLAARRRAALGDPREVERESQRLKRLYSAGRVNRLLYSNLGNQGYSIFLRLMARAKDPRRWLQRRYAGSPWKGLFAPAAGALLDRAAAASCDHEGCDCTWCRCHRDPQRGAS